MPDVLLLGICGSLRQASTNRALLRALAEVMPAGARLELYERLGELPLFNSDLGEPAPVTDLKAAIARADGVVFGTPEYNYSIPGVLKNALDWASRPPASSPMRGKPVGMIGAAAGMSGSMRAQLHLRQMMVFSDTPTLNQPEVLIPRAHERFDAAGQLTDDSTRDLLRKFAVAMVAHVERHRPR
jgi:chromate reductase